MLQVRALLNLLGPLLGKEDESNPERQGFKKLLSIALTIGMINEPLRAQQSEMLEASKGRLPDRA